MEKVKLEFKSLFEQCISYYLTIYISPSPTFQYSFYKQYTTITSWSKSFVCNTASPFAIVGGGIGWRQIRVWGLQETLMGRGHAISFEYCNTSYFWDIWTRGPLVLWDLVNVVRWRDEGKKGTSGAQSVQYRLRPIKEGQFRFANFACYS